MDTQENSLDNDTKDMDICKDIDAVWENGELFMEIGLVE